MKTLKRKKVLRKVNKIVRELNNAILNDPLWRGRFYIRQKETYFYTYEDKSGTYGHLVYEFIDLKTKQKSIKYFELIDFEPPFISKIFLAMNDFIINDCKVWEENPRPSIHNVTIYRKDNSMPLI